MDLPITPPFPPMEAETREDIPAGEGWQFEPKWDGFRCLAFRDGDSIELQSKAGKPLARYFPDVVEALGRLGARRFVLDGELVVPVAGELSFDELQLRLHPAESRVRKLAAAHPAQYLVFDLLVTERRRDLVAEPLAVRRERLERFAGRYFAADPEGGSAVHRTPATTERDRAEGWFRSAGASLDGIMAKRLSEPYRSGERSAMWKVKKLRTADCVVGGFRYGRNDRLVASLLLGLYDGEGRLNHVGYTSSLSTEERRELTRELESLRDRPAAAKGFTGNAPGGPSRWTRERDSEWEPLPPKLVAEVVYDHFSGGRFRHGTRLLRFRPDKPAATCGYEQIPSGARLTPLLADSFAVR
ncbi:MAG TPA: ATP-dependent DNA ligase [Thermoanaerobaculia bacterium]|nr:ATP-dependent DNA ligase [Thermoanaerobaculia bacterium]